MANTFTNKLRISGAPKALRAFLNDNNGPYSFGDEPDDRPNQIFQELDDAHPHTAFSDDAINDGRIGFRYCTLSLYFDKIRWLSTKYQTLIFDFRFFDSMGCAVGMYVALKGQTIDGFYRQGPDIYDQSLGPIGDDFVPSNQFLVPDLAAIWNPWFDRRLTAEEQACSEVFNAAERIAEFIKKRFKNDP